VDIKINDFYETDVQGNDFKHIFFYVEN